MFDGEGCTSPERNIVLTGFMGAGKTEVGRILARIMRRQFADTDILAARAARMSIPAVFERFGEARFRELELDAARELAMQRRLIIATGGGLPFNGKALDELRIFGFIVYVEWPYEALWERISKTGRMRPLVRQYGMNGLRELFAKREERYRDVELVVSANGLTPKEIARVILHAFKS
jgi:shikimate kinase